MLHVRVDIPLKSGTVDVPIGVGPTLSDAVRIQLTHVATEAGLPAELASDPYAFDDWFRANVRKALDDPRPAVPHAQAMREAQALIDRKRRARS